jgi:hypothetical protein
MSSQIDCSSTLYSFWRLAFFGFEPRDHVLAMCMIGSKGHAIYFSFLYTESGAFEGTGMGKEAPRKRGSRLDHTALFISRAIIWFSNENKLPESISAIHPCDSTGAQVSISPALRRAR